MGIPLSDSNRTETALEEVSRFISLTEMERGCELIKYSHVGLFSEYSGESICFSAQILTNYLDKNYPLQASAVKNLIADETEAEKKFRAFMSENPNERISRSMAKDQFFHNLGTRAAARVWGNVSKDFPHLRQPGRKGGKS